MDSLRSRITNRFMNKQFDIVKHINSLPSDTTEINVSESFEDSNAVKFLFWKFSGNYVTNEKWIGEEETRHLYYSFSSEKKIVKYKEKNNAVETINEIFIDNNLIYNDKIPEKSKTYIDKDRSFYISKYWEEQIKKNHKPSAIKEQL